MRRELFVSMNSGSLRIAQIIPNPHQLRPTFFLLLFPLHIQYHRPIRAAQHIPLLLFQSLSLLHRLVEPLLDLPATLPHLSLSRLPPQPHDIPLQLLFLPPRLQGRFRLLS